MFEYPFVQTEKGAINNQFSACEPVSHILSTLLGSGLFGGYPYQPAIGYLFRNKPTFVFVYTNEFDNHLVRSPSLDSICGMPGVYEGNLCIDEAYVKFKTFADGKTEKGEDPLDPYCFVNLNQ